MKISGEQLANGVYIFNRYVRLNGEKKLKNTYKIKKTNDSYALLDRTEKIGDIIRRVEIRKANMALIWAQGSRLGLLYDYEKVHEEILESATGETPKTSGQPLPQNK